MKFPRRLDFVALTVGAIIPDLLDPFAVLGAADRLDFANLEALGSWIEAQPHRDWTHSLLGAVTFDALLAIAVTVLLARPLLARADRKWPSGLFTHFAGLDFRAPTTWSVTLFSVWVGTLSHVLIDAPFHERFRLLFPIAPPTSIIAWQWLPEVDPSLLLGPIFAYLLYKYWWKPSRNPRRPSSPRAGRVENQSFA